MNDTFGNETNYRPSGAKPELKWGMVRFAFQGLTPTGY